MDGPQHYAEAQRLISDLANVHGDREYEPLRLRMVAQAQAHATLALAAAVLQSAAAPLAWTRPDWQEAAYGSGTARD